MFYFAGSNIEQADNKAYATGGKGLHRVKAATAEKRQSSEARNWSAQSHSHRRVVVQTMRMLDSYHLLVEDS